MNVALPVLMFALLTLVTGLCWWLMAKRPQQWARWVERENSFWLGKGLISAALAERMKRWETGPALKLLLAVATLAGILGVALTGWVLVKAISLETRPVPRLYNPSLVAKPLARPATNRPPAKVGLPATTNKNIRP